MAKPPVPEVLPCIALAGPTASGKTAAALAIARELPVEIVSVDSALVYRGLDIGTAKPDAAERAAVPHHLIDIRDPAQTYSAAEFAADARRLVGEIRARGAVPLLVGGTLLYFKALFEGLAQMPAADPLVRAALEARARVEGWPALHAELARVDASTAARLAPHDAQRIQRALEVWQLSGRPLSEWHAQAREHEVRPPALLLSLEPAQRSWLHERIAQRFEHMLRSGLLDEVRALRARPGLSPELPSMRCVGYRQAWEWLDAQERGEAPPLSELQARGIAATRQLAKRQLTWLRGMSERVVIACDAPDALDRVLQAVRASALAKGAA
ncbi:tRNA (adenosine(37)-N6)-dimethylallyltransferase MiaA [Ramlibacter rhizophilus]|uniref:tRNA dimethylallyltransferase n=1 Tax=Ramlibacter rhizophilus TaxID=1781167 RepID=A0A4Z0BZ36_9BURK|nr:tRNA (adenosine(37)-N6)-dimethylallyltransferase MiaA [Ramlibacter rhizophilus]TFZ04231.1 tRNA (adenosine(37)-N6)-dimethylallyltransferase MiaA [Ramlibacter rhizophilus]